MGFSCGLSGKFCAQRGDPRPQAAGSVRSAAAARCAASEGLGNGQEKGAAARNGGILGRARWRERGALKPNEVRCISRVFDVVRIV